MPSYSAANRANGTSLHPCAQFVKFTEDQNTRLHRARLYKGLTVQTFAHAAVMRAIAETEAEMEREEEKKIARQTQRASQLRKEPAGLGIRDRAEADRAAREAARAEAALAAPTTTPAPLPSAAQVHVQVTTPTTVAVPAEEIAALARYVVDGGPGYGKQNRLREVVERLARRASTREAAAALADRLDEEIKKLRPPSTLAKVKARIESRRKK